MKLIDNYGRVLRDLRISITPRCNYHCVYCHPLGMEMSDPPGTVTTDDVRHFLRAAARLGMDAVRFTGGEPLVRRELPEMIEAAAATPGVRDVAVTTNGTLFRRRHKELLAAGLSRVNISIDAVNPDVFRNLTRGGEIAQVWDAIELALELELHPVKLNAVVIGGINDQEVGDLAALSVDRPLHVRFIEYMHLNNAPFDEYQRQFVSGAETRRRIEERFGPLEEVPTDPSSPARVWKVAGSQGTIGFINSVSEPFCSNCTRLRLTSDKKIRPCLLTDLELDIAWAFEADDPVAALQEALLAAAGKKPRQGSTLPTVRERVMLGIGG
ncbi:GTP 3',8-cyclase MoaA [Oceanithermus desulfurans]|uniref:Cyclic pyranopterin phosphate synthase n=2 Tax=Oceanithermus desulfurans TaxID=227924 RepID=A0A511RHT6_9DEIN|nr:GTP 3',8-cyclase MoaA [Oceanithermus desulfurans]MBB6029154.1 cyclic pyranopterin phosphate synthase [Oceanithermus desulfurans]GEM89208.1 cyclic pyranopterin phosphate synthase [Oceanithermus desulfurans NBRC 100063]